MPRLKLSSICWGWLLVGLGSVVRGDDEVLTFFATSDSHYEAIEKIERNDRNRVTIERMNALPGEAWPDKLGGGPIGRPRGVLALGDLIDDGDKSGQTDIEWKYFSEHFGLDGTDGLLKYPVFEGWGNHDGPPEKYIKQRVSVQTEIKRRNVDRLEKKRISRVSANGLHYSWDWNGIHFIQTNLYPADKQNAKVRYSLPWHDPQDALAFVKEDLAATVGTSGRPVIIMAHCGFDTDWWVADDWKAFYDAVKPYNLLAYFHGHSGTGVRKWKPEGEEQPLDVITTGHTEKGFFVVEITKERMRLGFHVKKDTTVLKGTEWEWRYLFEKPLSAPKRAPAVRKVTDVSETLRQSLTLAPFYQQHVDADGLAIVGSKQVQPAALLEAAYLVDRMLDGRDDLRRAIAAAKVRVTVMAADEFTTDVPEHADLTPAAYWNRRARGLGATPARPSVSCGEENLLQMSGDPYHGENILIHEFAHTIHEFGLEKTDPTFNVRLRAAFDQAKERGLWKDVYAATNPQEYWAEGVQSWFDCNRAPDKTHNHIRTREALKKYDPALARLTAEVFGEQAWRYTTPRRRTEALHLSNVDWDALPRFEWPAELLHATDSNRR